MGIKHHHVFSCENEPQAVKTIQANFAPQFLYPDIMTRNVADMPSVDVYIAGFPCQPFSVAGKQQGFDDSKGRGDFCLQNSGFFKGEDA